MLKRAVPVMLMSPVMLPALLMLADPSRASAVGTGEMAPAPAPKGGVGPGQWQEYDPAQEPGSGGKATQVPSGTLVVIAYVIIWAVVLLYVLVLALRQRRLASEVEQLRQLLDELNPPAGAGDTKKT